MVFSSNVTYVPSGMGILKCFNKEDKSLLHYESNSCCHDGNVLSKCTYCAKDISKLTRRDCKVINNGANVKLCSEYHLCVGKVHVFIPKKNLSGHTSSDFGLKIISQDSYFPTLTRTQHICSPIIHVKPHGAKFPCLHPVTIHLPMNVHLAAGDEVACLCSNTDINEDPVWEPLDPDDFEVCGSLINLRTTHFSFFTAVVNKPYPEASKMIFAGVGGTLEVPEVPGVKVTFPGAAVLYDIQATIKVMYADGPYDVDHDDPTSYALAAPVVKLGPTGHEFNLDSIKPVEVQLPLPHGKEIMENCARPRLLFWQSTTAEGQELEWKLVKREYTFIEDDDNNLYVCFPVAHFSFFKAVWKVLDSVLHEARIGASYWYPNFEFCISFQAFMSENIDDQTFGLCCLCFKSGTSPESIGNYPVFVGSSGLRMVNSGLLQIRIVSNLFEGNVDFGEESLAQREVFTGRPFDKQFACKFVEQRLPGQNTIGKIYIEKVHDNSQVEPLFDFLLTKPPPSQEKPLTVHVSTGTNGGNGHHHQNRRAESVVNQANWENQLSQELANILSIKTDQDLGDGVWEEIARGLGYTELEIDMKFKDADEPLEKLLNDYKKRGGSPNDFISAMYSVGRKTNLSHFESRIRDALPSSSGRDFDDDVAACAGSISPSHTSSSSGVVLPSTPFSSRKRRHTDAPEGPVSNAKLTKVAERVQEKWKKLGRALELREDQITEIELNYKNDVQEQAYQMLMTWRECYPDNGKETLYQALGKVQLNAVARLL